MTEHVTSNKNVTLCHRSSEMTL